jgi:23S rRNA (guanine745-N1)-methyltransferase
MKKNLLKCPLCHKPLVLNHHWSCGHHHFDKAKEGYVNLCIPPIKGDDLLLVQAREHFFSSNPYEPLMNQMKKWIQPNDVVLDVGCGVGAYLKYFSTQDESLATLGCDGSKIAIKKAAKHDPLSQYVVANMNNLPYVDHQVDVILSVFAPYDIKEIKRVLKPTGRFILITPATHHLVELKKLIYDEVKLNPSHSSSLDLTCIEEQIVTFTMHLNQSQLLSLFQMTPYAYKSSNDATAKIQSLETLNVTASFVLQVFQT